MDTFKFVENILNEKEAFLVDVSKQVWENPETRFEEYTSAKILMDALKEEGFNVTENLGGIKTAFKGSFGSGSPVIGVLGEFDALSGLSQEGGIAEHHPIVPNGNGHGCGHNLLGTGALAAAISIKEYMEENNLSGIIEYYGCPGEEGGSGKTFMARENVFDGLDVALTWHPSPTNSIMSKSSLANYQVKFKFKGISSHAAASPHLGRSALDAVELMSSGVNYLREHIIPEARIHYAVTNAGGHSPNVVQSDAEVLYLIRSPQLKDVESIYKRVCKVAKGAAMMTETNVTIEIDKACSNYVPNRALEAVMYEQLKKCGNIEYSEEEKSYAKEIWNSLNQQQKEDALPSVENFGAEDSHKLQDKYLSDVIHEYVPNDMAMPGSTDVSDVSWNAPTAQCSAATCAMGTPFHSWQMVAQGVTSVANKGMLRAGKVMGLTGIEILNHPEKLEEIKREHTNNFKDRPYHCPIPDEVSPSTL
jgi:aminobenzoyl-glutamate utilization protein B